VPRIAPAPSVVLARRARHAFRALIVPIAALTLDDYLVTAMLPAPIGIKLPITDRRHEPHIDGE
jgi:hypothetical protein